MLITFSPDGTTIFRDGPAAFAAINDEDECIAWSDDLVRACNYMGPRYEATFLSLSRASILPHDSRS